MRNYSEAPEPVEWMCEQKWDVRTHIFTIHVKWSSAEWISVCGFRSHIRIHILRIVSLRPNNHNSFHFSIAIWIAKWYYGWFRIFPSNSIWLFGNKRICISPNLFELSSVWYLHTHSSWPFYTISYFPHVWFKWV